MNHDARIGKAVAMPLGACSIDINQLRLRVSSCLTEWRRYAPADKSKEPIDAA
jgi:hypothetical protein